MALGPRENTSSVCPSCEFWGCCYLWQWEFSWTGWNPIHLLSAVCSWGAIRPHEKSLALPVSLLLGSGCLVCLDLVYLWMLSCPPGSRFPLHFQCWTCLDFLPDLCVDVLAWTTRFQQSPIPLNSYTLLNKICCLGLLLPFVLGYLSFIFNCSIISFRHPLKILSLSLPFGSVCLSTLTFTPLVTFLFLVPVLTRL